MSALGTIRLGSSALGGGFLRVPPTVSITAPTGSILSTPVTVTWSYSSPAARVQYSYRVRLLSQDGTITLFDSATVLGTATSHSLSYSLSSGSTYQIWVTCSDGIDASTAEQTFTFDGGVADDVELERSVGTVYEVGINGTGYMLADHPDRQDLRYERRIVPLDSPRLATSDTPFSQAIDRYTLASGIDWSDGAGQLAFDREFSSTKAFRRADGIDPFSEPGSLRLVPEGALHHSDNHGNPLAVVAGDKLYVVSSTGELSAYDSPADMTATTFTITGAGAVYDMTSDGVYWYYCDGSSVYRNSSAADPAGAWSASNAELVEWCTDRIFIARAASGSTPNALYEMAAAGTEVGGSRIWTLPEGTTIRSITSGDGWVWFSATRSDRSAIYAVQLGSDNAQIVALEMPAGLSARAIGYYQGNLFIRAVDSAGRAIIYRCAVTDGKLTPTRVLEIEDPDGGSMAVGAFAGDDRFVYFSWTKMGLTTIDSSKDGSGIGCIDLSTGGWTKWSSYRQATTEGEGEVRSIVLWYGRPVFTVDSLGAVVCGAETGGDEQIAPTGCMETSLIDLGTGLRKVWGELTATFDPLPSGGEITVSYSTDGGVSYTALESVTTTGSKSARWSIGEESDVISFKVLLEGTTTSPSFRTLTVRANPVGLADQILILPINCADTLAGLNGRPLPDNRPGAGSQRVRALEALAQSRVTIQDVDWAVTGTTHVYDLIGVETRTVGVFDGHKGRQGHHMVAVCTLRRSYR